MTSRPGCRDIGGLLTFKLPVSPKTVSHAVNMIITKKKRAKTVTMGVDESMKGFL